MLREILHFLVSPISNTPKPQTTFTKPLVMKTVYASNCSNLYQSASQHIQHLEKQRKILKSEPAYHDAEIEVCSLDKDTLLIGFIKYQKTIMQGIFMYPEKICHSEEWKAIEQQAASNKIGIAIFKPKGKIQCLKINKSDKTPLYLIDNRLVHPIKHFHADEYHKIVANASSLTPRNIFS